MDRTTMDIVLILFLTLMEAFSCRGNKIFQPRELFVPAERIIRSSRENFMLDTRTDYIPYEKQVHSSKE